MEKYDVLVVGGTPAGCCAAIAAARRGAKVCMLEPTQELGGLTSNGIGIADTGTLQAVTGIFAEFLDGVQEYYAERSTGDVPRSRRTVYWEAHVAEAIWAELVSGAGDVTVEHGAVAVGVETQGDAIVSVEYELTQHPMGNLPDDAGLSESVQGTVVIDATYEGDIAAWTGVPFRLGREPRSPEEPHAGRIYTGYMERDIAGGFLPQTLLPGSSGEGDDKIMASNCRLICKFYEDASEEARHRLTKPDGYDPDNYEYEIAAKRGKRYLGSRNPGGKFDTNRLVSGNDLAEICAEYVQAHPRDRGPLRKRFVNHALGYLYYVQTEGGCPEIGLADDEFQNNDGVPRQIYIREGRRIEGLYTLTEQNTNPYLSGDGLRPPHLTESVAIADFEMDTKIHVNKAEDDKDVPEGAFFFRQLRCPVQIPFGCVVPRSVTNLLVPCALSATHVAFSVARMEPAWAQLGHAAGVAAAISVDSSKAVQEISAAEVQEGMMKEGFAPVYFSDVDPESLHFTSIQRLAIKGYVPSDTAYRFRPDDPVTRAELCEIVAHEFGISKSVTGSHFFDVPPRCPYFVWVETIYDLSTREGVEIIPGTFNLTKDNFHELHRTDSEAPHLLQFSPSSHLTMEEAVAFVRSAAAAAGIGGDLPDDGGNDDGHASRGDVCIFIDRFRNG